MRTIDSMGDPIAILKQEHRVALEMVNSLVALFGEGSRATSPDRTRDISFSLTEYLDSHMKKEEQTVFAALLSKGEEEPIAAMVEAHRRITHLAAQLGSQFGKEISDAKEEEFTGIEGLAEQLAGVLSEHFSKEDNVLFWMADLALTDEQRREIARTMSQIPSSSDEDARISIEAGSVQSRAK